jgi:anti-sigma B factor antagonist
LTAEQAPGLAIRHSWDGGVATVTVEGEIDASTVGALSACLGDVARQHPRRLVIDLARVSFIDSAGLAGFARMRKALPADCPVVICSAQRRVRQVFNLTGLASVFSFE